MGGDYLPTNILSGAMLLLNIWEKLEARHHEKKRKLSQTRKNLVSAFDNAVYHGCMPELFYNLILQQAVQTHTALNFEENVMNLLLSTGFLLYVSYHNQMVVNQVNDFIHYPLY